MWALENRPTASEWDRIEAGQSDIAKQLGAMDLAAVPHMLFYGPPGTGKTTMARAFIERHYPAEEERRSFLMTSGSELRTSSELGGIIRFTKKPGSKTKPRFIMIDEADGMTKHTQERLSALIERLNHTKTCRIILCANYIQKIVANLRSRCLRMYFHPLPPENVKEVIRLTLAKTGVTACDTDTIVEECGGDLRDALTHTEMLRYVLHSGGEDELTATRFFELTGVDTKKRFMTLLREVVSQAIEIDEGLKQAARFISEEGCTTVDLATWVEEVAAKDETIHPRMRHAMMRGAFTVKHKSRACTTPTLALAPLFLEIEKQCT